MQTSRIASVFVTLAVTSVAMSAQSVLVLQNKLPLTKDNIDINVPVADYIAQQLDTEGRISPIVYSETDPVFRAAEYSGRIKNPPQHPNLQQLLDVAHGLGVDYVLIVEAVRSGKNIKEQGRLLRNKKQVWKDDQTVDGNAVTAASLDDPNRTLARTIVLRLDSGPLKSFSPRPKTATPEASPGQAPKTTEVAVEAVKPVTDDQLKKDVDGLVTAGKHSNAVVMLRDAVDASPFDVDRRLELINLLLVDSAQGAAEEARRASELMPDKPQFRSLAARAWMQAGNPDEAQKDLNEAIARDPNGVGTRLMLAELSLSQLQPEKALDHLDQAIKQQDSSQARFLRAVCRGLLGGTDGMKSDLAAADKLQPVLPTGEIAWRYYFAVDITDRLLAKDGAQIRVLTQRIVVKPKDKELIEQIEQTSRLLQARTALVSAIVPVASEKQTNEKRLLCQTLMEQCLADLQMFSSKTDEDALADSRINLGEALNQLASIRHRA